MKRVQEMTLEELRLIALAGREDHRAEAVKELYLRAGGTDVQSH